MSLSRPGDAVADISYLYYQSAEVSSTGEPVMGSTQRPPPGALGLRIHIEAGPNDKNLFYYTTASGALVEGSGRPNHEPASTESAWVLPAGSGGTTFMLVENDSGSTIEQGTPVVLDAVTGKLQVKKALTTSSPATVVGIAQFDIPNDRLAFVAVDGFMRYLSGGSTAGVGLKLDASTAGRLLDGTAGDDLYGVAVNTVSAAAIGMLQRL